MRVRSSLHEAINELFHIYHKPFTDFGEIRYARLSPNFIRQLHFSAILIHNKH
jgi:hypothetical protein